MEAGAELVGFARAVSLVCGERVAINGSKFRVVSSDKGPRERDTVKRYLDQLEHAGEQGGGHRLHGVSRAAFSLRLHPKKTRMCYATLYRRERGLCKPATFTYLGFTMIWGQTQKGGQPQKGRFQLSADDATRSHAGHHTTSEGGTAA